MSAHFLCILLRIRLTFKKIHTMNTVVDTALIQSLDRAHFMHPFTDFKDLGSRGARVITRAEGIYVWDSEGCKMLDAMSGLWCVNVGTAAVSWLMLPMRRC